MTVTKCNNVPTLTGKWVDETNGITEIRRQAIAMELKRDTFIQRFG